MSRDPIWSSLLNSYNFCGADGSDPNDSRYTLSIRNDLGIINGVPSETGGEPLNIIHTWIVVTDKLNPSVQYSISFASDTNGFPQDWKVIQEDPIESIGNHRYTEEFSFNISHAEWEMLRRENAVNAWWEGWKNKNENREKFSFFTGGPDDEQGTNCTLITGYLLSDYLGRTDAFIDCLSPMDMSIRFRELELIQRAMSVSNQSADWSFDFTNFIPSTESALSREDLYKKAAQSIIAAERMLRDKETDIFSPGDSLYNRLNGLSVNEMLKQVEWLQDHPLASRLIRVFINDNYTTIDLAEQIPDAIDTAVDRGLMSTAEVNQIKSEMVGAILSGAGFFAQFFGPGMVRPLIDQWMNQEISGLELADQLYQLSGQEMSPQDAKTAFNKELAGALIDYIFEKCWGIGSDYNMESYFQDYLGQNHSNFGYESESGKVFTGKILMGSFGGDETLAGGDGDDILISGGGENDTLIGGDGFDTYIVGNLFTDDYPLPEPTVTIIDSDGKGQIIYSNWGQDYLLTGGANVDGEIVQYIRRDSHLFGMPGSFKITYVFEQSATDEEGNQVGELSIYQNSNLIAVVEDFIKYKTGEAYLGISLTNEVRDPESGSRSHSLEDGHNYVLMGGGIVGASTLQEEAANQVLFSQERRFTLEDALQRATPNALPGQISPYWDVQAGGEYEDVILGSDAAEVIWAAGGNDYVVGGRGNDYIWGGDGNDYIVGGLSPVNEQGVVSDSSSGFAGDGIYTDDDYLVGGAGQDMIIGGLGNDIIICGESAGETGSTTNTGDWAAGGQGNDIIYGSRDSDILMGGAGRDFIEGNGGNDIIFGDADEFQVAHLGSTFAYEFKLIYYEDNEGQLWKTQLDSNGNLVPTEIVDIYQRNPITGEIMLDPVTGEKIVIQKGSMAIYDPRGWTIIVTNDGNTQTWQRINHAGGGGNRIDPKCLEELQKGAHDDYLFGGAGDDMILGQLGDDVLDGGDGDDLLFGDEDHFNSLPLLPDGTSADGNDQLFGGAGADKLYGGGGNDILWADASYHDVDRHAASDNAQDELYGGAGNDILYAGTGNDLLFGGDGDDYLYGGSDTTQLSGDAGKDYLFAGHNIQGMGNIMFGGEGDDTLVSNYGMHQLQGGDGHDTYVYNSEKLRTDRAGIHDLIYDTDGDWSFILDGKTVTMKDMMYYDDAMWVAKDWSYVMYIDGPDLWLQMLNSNGQAIGKAVVIADGLYHNNFYEKGDIIINSNELIGGYSDDLLVASSNSDSIIKGGAGNDYIIGLGGNDTLYGGEGDDIMNGGAGNDLMHGDAGNDLMFGGAGNDEMYGGDGDDQLQGGSGNDILMGGAGDDVLFGEEGDDILAGGTGDDYLDGGAGNDTYIYNYGEGRTTISNYDTGANRRDAIKFGPDVNPNDIMIIRQGDDMIVTFYSDQSNYIYVWNHYQANGAYAINALEFSDGSVLNLYNQTSGFNSQAASMFSADSGYNFDQTLAGADSWLGQQRTDTIAGSSDGYCSDGIRQLDIDGIKSHLATAYGSMTEIQFAQMVQAMSVFGSQGGIDGFYENKLEEQTHQYLTSGIKSSF